MHHTIITIDIASMGFGDPTALLHRIDDLIAYSPAGAQLDPDEWKVRVHREHNGVHSAVPGWTTPEGVRV